MSNKQPSEEEILERAIRLAVDGGWHAWAWSDDDKGGSTLKYMAKTAFNGQSGFTVETIIFNHDFAKALWGDVPYENYPFGDYKDTYKYHLQMMVISDDPIQYLQTNLEKVDSEQD